MLQEYLSIERAIIAIYRPSDACFCDITRNAVIALYVLLECLKWISMLFKLSNIFYPYSIDCPSLASKQNRSHSLIEFIPIVNRVKIL